MIDLAAIDATGRGRMWDEVPVLPDSVGWVELEENGWGSLKAWAAGAGRVGRMPQDDSSRRVRVSCETGGVTTSWFLRLPDGWPGDRDFAGEFDGIVNTNPVTERSVMPDVVLGVMREAVRSLYR